MDIRQTNVTYATIVFHSQGFFLVNMKTNQSLFLEFASFFRSPQKLRDPGLVKGLRNLKWLTSPDFLLVRRRNGVFLIYPMHFLYEDDAWEAKRADTDI